MKVNATRNPTGLLSKTYTEDKVTTNTDVNNNKLTQDEGKPENEDTLDNFMKTIDNDTTMQDYQLYQMYYNQQLQKRYDDFANKEGNEFDDNVRDDVKMIDDDDEYKEYDNSKVITLDEIMKNCKAPTENANNNHEDEELNNVNQLNGKAREDKMEEDLSKNFLIKP